MGKLIFFDLDDCIVESSPRIQEAIDNNTAFKNLRLMVLDHVVACCAKVFHDNKVEVERAFRKGEKPNLVGSLEIGSNDIIKTSSGNTKLDALEQEKHRIESWYQQPLKISEMALDEAKWNREMFFEERDHFLESDNQLSEAYGLINYRDIYTEKNLVPGAIDMLNEVLDEEQYDGVYCLSHHNGGREARCKENFIAKITNNKLGFLGLRFHLEKYESNKRRQRSSKAVYIMQRFGLESLNNCILVDDSTANLDEWIKYGGIAVLYRPMSEDEKYQGTLNKNEYPYPRITEMSFLKLNEALDKYQVKIKKR